jgi:hypothetical protein
MDRGFRTSWLSRSSIHYWCLGVENWDQEFATVVGVSVLPAGMALSRLSHDRLVSMMSFMIALWWLVPASPRRVD